MNNLSIKKLISVFRFSPLTIVLVLNFILVIFFTWYVFKLDLTTRLVDQNSHLNLSRLVWDSLTPGISQVGFWPPLLHILMAPFTISDYLFRSGLSGAMISIPSFMLAGFFLYKLSFGFTNNRWLSIFAVLLFSLNPYILYYSATPMMELLFLCNLFGTTYFLFCWLKTESLRYLVATSFFVSLTTISRFEGLILIPLVGIFLLIDLIRKKKSFSEIEATGIIYSVFAGLGVLLIFSYGWAFGDNPLSFANSEWSAFSQQRDYFLPTEHNVFVSFQYLLHASYYMIGLWQVWIGIIFFVLLVLFAPSIQLFAVLFLLISPFLFDWLALFRGNIILYVADLPPYNSFFNERYGLYGIGFTAIVPVIFFGFIRTKYCRLKQFLIINGLVIFFIAVIIAINSIFLYKTAKVEKFKLIFKASGDYPSKDQKDIAYALDYYYDGGKILITRALHDFVTVNAGIPLKDYIHEANFLFYDQALERPWLFARWVVMYNLENAPSEKWAKKNEKVSAQWGHSNEFLQYYEPVVVKNREILYKIKEDAVKQYADEADLDPLKIPSLNINIKNWKPEKIYEQMKILD